MTPASAGAALQVAILQCEGSPGEPEANLALLDAACAQSVAAGDTLLVTPELFLSGYNIGPEAGRLAVCRDDPLLARLSELSSRHGIGLCVGYPERAEGAVYNSALLIEPGGQVLGNYRKHRPIGDYEHATFARGNTGDMTATIAGVQVGVLICYDVEFPENARRLARAGVELIIVPTALPHDFGFVSEKMVPTRAFENGVFVAYADRCGVEGERRYAGLSCIVAPDGGDLARAGTDDAVLRARVAPADYAHLAERLPYLRDLDAG